jgi:hypothetical protein
MDAIQQGKEAFAAGLQMVANPYSFTTLPESPEDEERNVNWMDWNLGYYKARKASLNLKY